jgi:hypothetical protein
MEVHNRVHNSSLFIPILNQMDQVYIKYTLFLEV